MKSKLIFTEEEAQVVRKLLRLKARAMPSEQKSIQAHLRRLGLYTSDFDSQQSGFGAADFDRLVREGTFRIEPVGPEKIGN